VNSCFFISTLAHWHISTLLLFLDFSAGELLVIFLAVFILFGPKKMPEMARKIGKFINDLKRASEKIKHEINEETKDVTKDIKDIKDKSNDLIG
jgi:sec-independent protein translocase protein TatA